MEIHFLTLAVGNLTDVGRRSSERLWWSRGSCCAYPWTPYEEARGRLAVFVKGRVRNLEAVYSNGTGGGVDVRW